MRILVTGVSGFVGVRLAKRLVADRHQVWGTFISTEPRLDGVRLVEADLRDPQAVAGVIEQSDPDAVVHLGGLTHVGESWKRMHDYFSVNVLGTEHLLRAAGDRPVVVASSAEVYGLVPEGEQPIAESRPTAPQSPYALTKAAAERLALLHGASVVRSFNLAGPGQAETFALPSFARQLAAIARGDSEPVLEVGNLAARRDFLHIDDGVDGYLTVLERGERGQIYNLGSGRAVAIGDALAMLIEASGVSVTTRVDPERWRPVDLPCLQADCSRLQQLGWRARRDFRGALQDLWRSAREG